MYYKLRFSDHIELDLERMFSSYCGFTDSRILTDSEFEALYDEAVNNPDWFEFWISNQVFGSRDFIEYYRNDWFRKFAVADDSGDEIKYHWVAINPDYEDSIAGVLLEVETKEEALWIGEFGYSNIDLEYRECRITDSDRLIFSKNGVNIFESDDPNMLRNSY
jgi:hypothetical protein